MSCRIATRRTSELGYTRIATRRTSELGYKEHSSILLLTLV